MSDERMNESQPEQQTRRSVNLQLEGAELHYANVAVVTSTPEEVVLNFGVNAVPPNREGQTTVPVTDRVILSYPSAKRLAVTLGNIVRRYEDRHGVIEIRPRSAMPGASADTVPEQEG
ncbi:MAG: DUF3467 domain-containing protein [Candidatus Brocadiaceae bacterium]|jgi:hypothetical protein